MTEILHYSYQFNSRKKTVKLYYEDGSLSYFDNARHVLEMIYGFLQLRPRGPGFVKTIEFKNLYSWVRKCLLYPNKYKAIHGFRVEMISIEEQENIIRTLTPWEELTGGVISPSEVYSVDCSNIDDCDLDLDLDLDLLPPNVIIIKK